MTSELPSAPDKSERVRRVDRSKQVGLGADEVRMMAGAASRIVDCLKLHHIHALREHRIRRSSWIDSSLSFFRQDSLQSVCRCVSLRFRRLMCHSDFALGAHAS